MVAYLWIALGGALGSVSRYWLNSLFAQRFVTFPMGTLVVNVIGSFVIGVIAAFTMPEGRLTPGARAFAVQFLIVGICGGFTTFSSFSLQTLMLVREREWLYAGGNIVLSVVLCLVATWLGFLLGSVFSSARGN